MIALCRCFALLGLTLQLALLDDIISLLTIHIFCLYTYAQRLFQLQTSVLIELGRLFRGKKYNPLRKRVRSTCPVSTHFCRLTTPSSTTSNCS
jgi:phosphatidylinositol glycan class Q protein